MDVLSFLTILSTILGSLPTTLYLAVSSLIWSLILGAILTLLQESRYRILAFITKCYVDLIRGAPLLLLILLIFYGGKLVLNNLHVNTSFMSDQSYAIVAISVSMSAYFSELMRSSYRAVSPTQREAIKSINMPPFIGMVRILFPQMLIIALPNLSNLLINLIKLTSLVSVIGIADIFNKAQKISQNSYGLNQIPAFIGVIVIYWALNALIFVVLKKLENKYKYLLD